MRKSAKKKSKLPKPSCKKKLPRSKKKRRSPTTARRRMKKNCPNGLRNGVRHGEQWMLICCGITIACRNSADLGWLRSSNRDAQDAKWRCDHRLSTKSAAAS